MNNFPGIVNIPVKEVPRTQKQRKKNWKCNYPGCNESTKTRYNCYAHIWDIHLKPKLASEESNNSKIILTSFKNSNDKAEIKKMCERYMIKLVDKTQGRQTFPFAFTDSMASVIGLALNKIKNEEHEKELEKQRLDEMKNERLKKEIELLKKSNTIEIEMDVENERNNVNNYNINTINKTYSIDLYNQQDLSEQQQIQQINQQMKKEYENKEYIIQTNSSHEQSHSHTISNENMNNFILDSRTSQNISFQDQSNSQEYEINDLMKIKKISNKLQQLCFYGEIFANEGFLVRSDERSKMHIETIQNALNSLVNLCGKQYKYKTDADNYPPRYGFIAQEVEQIFPELVLKDDLGYESVDMLGIIPILVESIKEIKKDADSLTKKTRDEYKLLSVTAQNTLVELNYIQQEYLNQLEENKYEINRTKPTLNGAKHIFGPTIFTFFMAVGFTIASIILPLVKQLIVIEVFLVLISMLLWVFVVINKKDLRDVIIVDETIVQTFKKTSYWGTPQVIIWSIITTLIVCSVTISLIMGVMGIIITILYLMCFFSLMTMLMIIYFNCKYQYTSTIIYLTLLGFHLIGSVAILSCVGLQPYEFFEFKQYNTMTSIQTNVNQTIVPVDLPKLPWNCINPRFIYQNELPQDIKIVLPKEPFDFKAPKLCGKVLQPCSFVSHVQLVCGVSTLDYVDISFEVIQK